MPPRLTFTRDLAVIFDADGVRVEKKPVLVVVEGVEDDLNGVRLVQRPIAAAVGDENLARIRVEENDADVERRLIEKKPDLGAFTGGCALDRVLLCEAGIRSDVGPRLFGNSAVDDDVDAFFEILNGQRSGLGAFEKRRGNERGDSKRHGDFTHGV